MSIKDVIASVESPNWNNLTQADTLEILKSIDYLLSRVVSEDIVQKDLPKFAEDKIEELNNVELEKI